EDQKCREEWQGSVLMAAYRGSPAAQPVLADVFRAYASCPAERAQICVKYLQVASEVESKETLVVILADFLFPPAMKAGLTTDQLLKIVRAAINPTSKCLIEIAPNSSCEPFEQRSTGAIAVADYMIALLWLIAKRGFLPFVQKQIEKHYAALTM